MTITGTAHYKLRKNETQQVAQYWMLQVWKELEMRSETWKVRNCAAL